MVRYLPIVWSALRRKPVRSVVTALSIGAAFMLFGLLKGMTLGFDAWLAEMSETRLYVQNRTLSSYGMPITYVQQVKEIEGVEMALTMNGMGGYYQDEKNTFGIPAVMEGFFQMFPEVQLPDGAEAEFWTLRTAAIPGRSLAEKYGWQVGDHIPVIGIPRVDGSTTWEFDIVAIFDTDDVSAGLQQQMIMQYEYLNQSASNTPDTIYTVWVEAAPGRANEISQRIDDHFASSTSPTSTQTERENAENQLQRIGDIEFFVNAVVGASLFTILIVTAGTMVQSMVERIPEFAVLKSFGFEIKALALITLLESFGLCLAGAILGVSAAYAAAPWVLPLLNPIVTQLPLSLTWNALGVVLLMSAICAIWPTYRLAHNSVVDGLAGR
ncbi:MAG: ABC transporter permease [Proteobacteria bacterium]|nr:ABC transporter permease [Pseudomonadota bacterium]MDA1299711.1 ABC transporter permease [Pseudomonadota bacterium]